jgi:hypothetical protein
MGMYNFAKTHSMSINCYAHQKTGDWICKCVIRIDLKPGCSVKEIIPLVLFYSVVEREIVFS